MSFPAFGSFFLLNDGVMVNITILCMIKLHTWCFTALLLKTQVLSRTASSWEKTKKDLSASDY